MSMPGFSADASLRSHRPYSGRGRTASSRTGRVVPAIPFCGNCDDILDRCAENGFRPRAVCRACYYGNCYSGVEDPTPNDPWTPVPGSQFPGI
jgi:hypothetical protein